MQLEASEMQLQRVLPAISIALQGGRARSVPSYRNYLPNPTSSAYPASRTVWLSYKPHRLPARIGRVAEPMLENIIELAVESYTTRKPPRSGTRGHMARYQPSRRSALSPCDISRVSGAVRRGVDLPGKPTRPTMRPAPFWR